MAETSTPGASVRQRYDGARTKLMRRRLADLPIEVLDRILGRIDDDQLEVVRGLESIAGRADDCLEEGDWNRFVDLRTRAVEVTGAYDELDELRRDVSDARQARLLNDRLIAKLGSARRLLAYDGFIMLLIVAVVSVLLVEIAFELPAETALALYYADVGACAIFLGDFFWRLKLSEQRGWFWRRYWLDFVTSIPLPSAQVLRLGRMVRLVRLARVLRVVQLFRLLRIVLFFWRGLDKLVATFDVKLMRKSMRILAVVLVAGGLGIYWAEGDPATPGVRDLGESLWWSFTTVVTGGFGDLHNPQTGTGRFLTVALIAAGMVVVGIFTATLTSLLVRENDTSGAIGDLEERMVGQIEELKTVIGSIAPPPPED